MAADKNTFIISGAPGTGKSTLIKTLRKEGFLCFEEIARLMIKKQKELGSGILPFENMPAFSKLVFEEMLKQNKIINNRFCFIDRSVVDIIGYLKFDKKAVDDIYYQSLKKFNYNQKVFYAPLWEAIYRKDEERYESFEQAKLIDECIKNEYKALGFNIIELPKSNVEDRVNFIKKHVFNQMKVNG